jgi:RNA polymerase sigma factor (sigma-70 family)
VAIDQTELETQDVSEDPSDLAAIVEAHWSAVYRLLYWMTGNSHDAEELTQETFLRAFRRMESFRPGTQLRSWLLRIATNACLDVKRKRRRARSVPLPENVPSRGRHPGYCLETAEQAELLQAAVEELTETTRAVFHLRVQESLPFREIAELLGSTEQAVRWHMHQARTKLLRRMEREVE